MSEEPENNNIDDLLNEADIITRDEFIIGLEAEIQCGYNYCLELQNNIDTARQLEDYGYRLTYYFNKDSNTFFYVNNGKRVVGFQANPDEDLERILKYKPKPNLDK